MKKIVLTYGLISGAIISVLLVILSLIYKSSGFANGLLFGYTTMVLSYIIIYPGLVSYRNNVLGGQIKFGRALVAGLLMTLVAAACYSIAWMIICKTIFPDFMDKYAEYMMQGMKKHGATADELAKTAKQVEQYKEMYKNPVTMFLLTLLEPLPVGIVISLISALVVSRKKKPAIA